VAAVVAAVTGALPPAGLTACPMIAGLDKVGDVHFGRRD